MRGSRIRSPLSHSLVLSSYTECGERRGAEAAGCTAKQGDKKHPYSLVFHLGIEKSAHMRAAEFIRKTRSAVLTRVHRHSVQIVPVRALKEFGHIEQAENLYPSDVR